MNQPKSWRTTALGIIGLLALTLNVTTNVLAGMPVDWGIVIPAFTAALTGFFARDQKAHDEGSK